MSEWIAYRIFDCGSQLMLVNHRPVLVRHVNVIDDQNFVVAVAVAGGCSEMPRVYAERIAELLNRHGLADVPDTMALPAPTEAMRRG
jgi:hypothetical protein